MAPPTQLPMRKLGRDGPGVSAMGFGAMGLSCMTPSTPCLIRLVSVRSSNADVGGVGFLYGSTGSEEEKLKLLDRVWELGCTFWDTAEVHRRVCNGQDAC